MINDSIIVAYGVVKSAEYHNALIKQFCNSVLEKYEEEFDEFFVLKDFYLKDNLMISATCYKPLRKEYYSNADQAGDTPPPFSWLSVQLSSIEDPSIGMDTSRETTELKEDEVGSLISTMRPKRF